MTLPEHELPENELKNALRRQEAPEGFTERVLARVAQQKSVEAKPAIRESLLNFLARPMQRWAMLRWAAAAALCAVLIAGGIGYRHMEELKAQREQAQGEAAKQQLMLALRIAGSKLQLARAKVYDVNSNDSKNRQVKE